MKRVLLAVALVAAAVVALAQDRNRLTMGRNQSTTGGFIMEFAPASGLGLNSVAELCDAAATHMSGGWWCMKSDGTAATGSMALTVSGPSTVSQVRCNNGTDCTAASHQAFTANGQNVRTADVASPTGDFTVCAHYRAAGDVFVGNIGSLVAKSSPTTGTYMLTDLGTTNAISVAFNDSNGPTAGSAVYGAWRLACTTYQLVGGASDNIVRLYQDGAQVGSTRNNAPLLSATSDTYWAVGADERNFFGVSGLAIAGAFMTERLLTAAEIAAIARAVLADEPRTTGGQALTFSRSGAAYCPNDSIVNGADAGVFGSWLPANRPCMRGGGILGQESRTNLTLRSTEFDHAAWTKTNITATANAQTAPDGTLSAETALVTTDGGYLESTAFIVTGTNVAGSVYIAPGSGEHVRIAVHDTDAGTQVCTSTITDANAAWQRLWCQSQTITTGNAYTVRVYPGKVGDSAKVWCAMGEADFFPTTCIRTEGTTVTRAAPTQTLNHGLSNSAGCIGATSKAFPMAATASSSRRILDFNVSNPLTYFSSGTQMAGDDSSTNVFVNFSSNAAGRFARTSFGWAGTAETGSADTNVSSQTYDGTMFSTNILAIGHDTGGSAYSNATIKEIRVGRAKDVCQ